MMQDVVWLRVSRYKVEGFTKNQPSLHRGEIPVKLSITVDESAFREPVMEYAVHVTDWREGLDFPGLEISEATITEAEAQMIRQRRLEAMQEALEQLGYTITPPEPEAAVETA